MSNFGYLQLRPLTSHNSQLPTASYFTNHLLSIPVAIELSRQSTTTTTTTRKDRTIHSFHRSKLSTITSYRHHHHNNPIKQTKNASPTPNHPPHLPPLPHHNSRLLLLLPLLLHDNNHAHDPGLAPAPPEPAPPCAEHARDSNEARRGPGRPLRPPDHDQHVRVPQRDGRFVPGGRAQRDARVRAAAGGRLRGRRTRTRRRRRRRRKKGWASAGLGDVPGQRVGEQGGRGPEARGGVGVGVGVFAHGGVSREGVGEEGLLC